MTGKIILMLYTVVGIPLSIAAYTYAAKFTIAVVSLAIETTESRLFNHKCVRHKQLKVLVTTLVLLILLVTAATYMTSKDDLDNLSRIDSVYFWFCTLSTVGYGDITFQLDRYVQNQPLLLFYILFTCVFGLGLIATIVSSFIQIIVDSKATEKAKQTSCCATLLCRNRNYDLKCVENG